MVFYIKDKTKSDFPILLACKGNNGKIVTFRDILKDDGNLLDSICKGFNINIMYEIKDNHVIYVLVDDESTISSNPLLVDFGFAINMSIQLKTKGLDDEHKKQYIGFMKWKFNTDLAESDVDKCFGTYYDFQDYLRTSMDTIVNTPGNYALSAAYRLKLQDINKSFVPTLQFVKRGKNRTRLMKKCTDEVFIELPSYDKLAGDMTYTLPTRNSVLPRLADPAFGTRMYKDVCTDADLPFIEGSAENNKLELQDNELEFYNALKEYIDFCIKQEFDKRPEELNNEEFMGSYVMKYLINLAIHVAYFNWAHTGLLPQLVKEYDNDDGDRTDDDDLVVNKYYVNMGVRQQERIQGDIELENFIISCTLSSDYLKLSYGQTCAVEHPYAIAEIIIKLLRFGTRKPNKLYISTYTRDLNLNTFEINARVECFSDGIPYAPSGREYIYECPIIMSGTVADKQYLNSLGIKMPSFVQPVGVVCIRESLLDKCPDGVKGEYEYEGSYYNSKCRQRVYMSLIDVYELISEKENVIEGITFQDGNIKVTDITDDKEITVEQAIRRCIDTKNVEDVFLTSKNITYLALNIKTSNKNVSYLNTFYKYCKNENAGVELPTLRYNTIVECAEIIKKTGKSPNELLFAKIADSILPQVLESMSKCEKSRNNSDTGITSIEEALNTLAITLCKNPIDLTLEDGKSKVTTKLGLDASNTLDKINKMNNAINNNTNVSQDSPSGIMNMDNIIESVPYGSKLYPVVKSVRLPNNKLGYKIICYFTVIGTPSGKKRLITSTLETTGEKIVVKAPGDCISREELGKYTNVKLSSILYELSRDFYLNLIGKFDDTRVRFTSEAVYANLIKEATSQN